MSRPRNAKRLELIHLEDRTVPSSVPVPMAIPPIGTPGGALAAENDFTDTDGNAPVQIHVLGNDQPTPGASLVSSSVHIAVGPARGTVAVDPATGDITYTAVGSFTGTVAFTYTVRDSAGSVGTASVSVVVNRPIANDDFEQTAATAPVAVHVLANDSDPDGNAEIVVGSVTVVQSPLHGGLSIDPATGITTYTPTAGFTGTDSWSYTIADMAGAVSAPGRVTVVVAPASGSPGSVPRALDDVADTDGNNPVTVGVLANDVASAGHALLPGSVSIAAAPQHGLVNVNSATGEITYTSVGFLMGTDSFTYTVADGAGVSHPATVTIIVNRPVANDDLADTDGNNPMTVDVLGNDTDPDGNAEIVPGSVAIVRPPSHGSVSVNPTTGAITYTAIGFFQGSDTFQYTIADLAGAVSAPGTVTIGVHRPTANPDTALAVGTAPVVIPVLANDTDPEGNFEIDPASVAIVAAPQHGSVAIDPATGRITYTPNGTFSGIDAFTYSITDFPGAVSSPGVVRIRVESSVQFTAVGAGAGGGPAITLFNTDGTTRASLFAFEPTFTGGVRVAVADVTGDGVPDIIAAPGAGGGPIVRVFDGVTLAVVSNFLAYDASFRGGLTVAVGDVNGDGTPDIITGSGNGGGPQVNAFDGATGKLLTSFFAFDSSFRGGVNVAAGDVNGDGLAEIITGAGLGGGPQVSIFNGGDFTLAKSFFAFDSSFRGGVTVAVGDTNGDTLPEVLAAAGPGGGPHVLIFDGLTAAPEASFFAYAPTFTGGVQLASADVNHDGHAELLVAPGPGQKLPVLAFSSDTLKSVQTLDPFYDFIGGVYLGGTA